MNMGMTYLLHSTYLVVTNLIIPLFYKGYFLTLINQYDTDLIMSFFIFIFLPALICVFLSIVLFLNNKSNNGKFLPNTLTVFFHILFIFTSIQVLKQNTLFALPISFNILEFYFVKVISIFILFVYLIMSINSVRINLLNKASGKL
jgi:hypothetical protein